MKRGVRKERTGIVISNKMEKTVVVELERVFSHPLYKKVIRRSNRIKAHDEDNSVQVGDKVVIVETRPYSKDKRWRVVEVLGKTKVTIKDLPKKSLKELKNIDMEEATVDSAGN